MRIFRCSRVFLLMIVLVVLPASLLAQVFVSVGFAPPLLPVYEQPLCPAAGYIWTPGYWAYGPEGYFWVPGTWVLAPVPGYLWTPGYWGWGGNAYLWHSGYWGPQVGYYGGINYGYGYTGYGYSGGYWRNRTFYYNRTVNNINVVNIHNVYNTTVVNQVTVNRVSYNGGNGGITARPTAAQEATMREQHTAATNNQLEHEQAARQDRSLLATVNHGQPPIAATTRPTAFHGPGVVAARNAPENVVSPVHSNPRTNETNVPHPMAAPSANVGRPGSYVPPEGRQNTYHGNEPVYPGNSTAAHTAPQTETPHEVPRPPAHTYQNEPRTQQNQTATPRGEQAVPREAAPHAAPEHGAPPH